MERSFSHLLRTSRLATFDKNINQIYTTSGKAKAIGDWGLKRNLPTVLRTHYLTIEQLDTAEHQTPFQSATSDFLFLQRWKENFPRSRPPQPQPVAVKKDLSTMTDIEFKKLLETAREKRQEWKAALSKGEVRSDEHLRFLNILTRHSKGSSIDTETSQASIGTSRSPANTSTSAPNAGSNSKVKVGPTYGFFEPSTPTIVQGRSLGRFRQNQVVGVSGVVATLPSYTHTQNTSKSLQPYYVHKAEIEADGRPNVVLSMSPPSPASWSTSSIGGGREMYSYNRNRYPQGAAAKAASSSSSETSPSEGTGHRKVITRVQGLLETLDQPNNRA
ncbi:hypothetical protein KI688_009495 [Linnemannia hyalina]|uniref:Uncharacterized protein n=1 Tax=Linnemannia hyalina TaxID=64524 RepID=A0A9P8BWC7_9FUNG|nr:hypothetical protein KI688_009495 [Linnemannia hyalina]